MGRGLIPAFQGFPLCSAIVACSPRAEIPKQGACNKTNGRADADSPRSRDRGSYGHQDGKLTVTSVELKAMIKKAISAGVVHGIPADLRKALDPDPTARAAWEDITPLARNEWICWIISVKKPETRRQHIERTRTELKDGMRRPCCWPGCPHR